MKEIIYLVVSPYKVERMTKNLPSLHRGEIPVKLTVNVDAKAFREPVISKEVYIEDWREGIDIADVEFKSNIITEEEAEQIRQRRLEKMRDILQEQGYMVTEPEVSEWSPNQASCGTPAVSGGAARTAVCVTTPSSVTRITIARFTRSRNDPAITR
jgi:hypothetical protein